MESFRWNLISKLQKISFKVTLPERCKGTVIEKWYRYWEGLIQDYTDVFHETVTDMKNKPFKAFTIAGVGGLCIHVMRNNPDEREFRNRLIEYQNSFGLVGKPIRNPSADVYLKTMNSYYNSGLIRRFSFGLFSIIWLDNYDSCLGLYKTRCNYLKPQYVDFYKRVIDVGFLNKYWIMEKKMEDYDVNPNEWIDFSKSEYMYRDRIPVTTQSL